MPNEKKIHLLGHKVYYEEYAKARENRAPFTFILIHGFLACSFSFRKLVPLLAENFDVYAIDLVGFGKSEKSRKFRYSYNNYGMLVLEFIKELGLKNVILMGHSMGGQIALYTARQSPQSIQALILAGCSGYLKRSNRWTYLLSYLPFVRAGMKWWIRRHKVEDVLKTTLHDPSLISQDMIDAYARPLKEKGFADTLLGLLRDREGDLLSDALNQIHHPTLLVWGEQDRIVPLRKGIQLRQDIPHSTLVSLPDAGHQVMEEKPEAVYSEIEEWLHQLNQ